MQYVLIFTSGGSIEFSVLACAEIYLRAWGGSLYAVDISGAVSRWPEVTA
jgi:hypothetical protein